MTVISPPHRRADAPCVTASLRQTVLGRAYRTDEASRTRVSREGRDVRPSPQLCWRTPWAAITGAEEKRVGVALQATATGVGARASMSAVEPPCGGGRYGIDVERHRRDGGDQLCRGRSRLFACGRRTSVRVTLAASWCECLCDRPSRIPSLPVIFSATGALTARSGRPRPFGRPHQRLPGTAHTSFTLESRLGDCDFR